MLIIVLIIIITIYGTPDADFLAEFETFVDGFERFLDVAAGFESSQETSGVCVFRVETIQVSFIIHSFMNVLYTRHIII